ncbi:hypothetical protein HDV02_006369 [Globomyces sp. JEL0801]|nr:hypothetical protein HDV02_006369 [Globomyces sp. JEL0801]
MRAIALYDCVGEDSSELSFVTGDVIVKVKPDQEPANYVRFEEDTDTPALALSPITVPIDRFQNANGGYQKSQIQSNPAIEVANKRPVPIPKKPETLKANTTTNTATSSLAAKFEQLTNASANFNRKSITSEENRSSITKPSIPKKPDSITSRPLSITDSTSSKHSMTERPTNDQGGIVVNQFQSASILNNNQTPSAMKVKSSMPIFQALEQPQHTKKPSSQINSTMPIFQALNQTLPVESRPEQKSKPMPIFEKLAQFEAKNSDQQSASLKKVETSAIAPPINLSTKPMKKLSDTADDNANVTTTIKPKPSLPARPPSQMVSENSPVGKRPVPPRPKARNPIINPPNQPQKISQPAIQRYTDLFIKTTGANQMMLSSQVKSIWIKSRLELKELGMIWNLLEPIDKKLNLQEFCIGMHLIDEVLRGKPIPKDANFYRS